MHTAEISTAARAFAILTIVLASIAPPARAEGPTTATIESFDRYIAAAEAQFRDDLTIRKNFLYIDALPEPERTQSFAALRNGQTLVRNSPQCQPRCPAAHGGLLHDWTAIVFVPGVTLAETLAALQDYDCDAVYYQPQVTAAKLLAKSNNRFRVFLRIHQTRIITVVLDTEYEIHYTTLDNTHAMSQSHSTRISEIENPNSPQERIISPGADHGFLWRLYSYWRFYRADGGVYIQCNAISLTRDVPVGLGWMIGPFIQKIPQESLYFTLAATRQALLQKFRNAPPNNPVKGELR
ncbi:MAG: hypothetical protein ABLT11_09585 [Candidatus Acidiferrum sp.]